VDIAGEKARLQKEIDKVQKDLDQCSRKLANRDFRERRPKLPSKRKKIN